MAFQGSLKELPLPDIIQLVSVSGKTGVFSLKRDGEESGERVAAAWHAPFPDRGYEAGLRALGPVDDARSGPSPSQAAALLQHAMGYLPP
jgi:tRNA(adenine34) deaminase